jgi:hypothetical protein
MRRLLVAGLLLCACLVGAGTLLVQQTKVPPQAVITSVTRSSDLLARAWQLPVAATFERSVMWQSNVSLCGPASIANVYRSLGDMADTEAKVLDGTGRCWTGFCFMGLTLDELAGVARRNTKRKITVLRDLNQEQFRDHLVRSNDPARRYIVNFTRRSIFGAGGGHHSPIGGYLKDEDLVLVVDVNRDFQPWLVERTRLFEAMNTSDGNKMRGLLLVE